MPPKFGTSGLRGLVSELTAPLITDHVQAFVRACDTGSGVFVARDLRPSSPAIAAMVMAAAGSAGLCVTDCGALPTPALALAAMGEGAAAIMVTGSHIPADRNGLKFYTPAGEITKIDETAILGALGQGHASRSAPARRTNTTAAATYCARYGAAYGPAALQGLRIGIYTHSAVGRDLLLSVFAALGASTLDLGRSDSFVPVDTEAVSAQMRRQLMTWAEVHRLDAIVSTDGDGDRPLMTDATGRIIPGDILGQITAATLGAQAVVTPISSNSGAEACGRFATVTRTRIGSPYVIAAMLAASGKVVGYEANGGFLLGFAAAGPSGPLPALLTRDSLLPLIAPLALARGIGLAAVVAAEPGRFTATGRLQAVPSDRGQALVGQLDADPAARGEFLQGLGALETGINRTDGLRLTLNGGRIVHLRPSGNAPELRFYAEAESPDAADELLEAGLAALRRMLEQA